uniref:Uncharacterized protein n=1 Tax=Octopus bimaculoides TaxID=37653 RepID=A0A0L8G1D0_OCTBM
MLSSRPVLVSLNSSVHILLRLLILHPFMMSQRCTFFLLTLNTDLFLGDCSLRSAK